MWCACVGVKNFEKLTMYMFNGETIAGRNVETSSHSIYLHVTMDLTSLRKSSFHSFYRLVILTLLYGS